MDHQDEWPAWPLLWLDDDQSTLFETGGQFDTETGQDHERAMVRLPLL